ncbi:MAG: AAA family ATPase [Deltaproteobacteria bacterium]|nr:AAA family ATPase [Deltaproteobacteria bacterium]
MYRKYTEILCDWKERSNRKPLVIRGARQVGKTYLIREWARKHFENYIELNFDETPSLNKLFVSDDVNAILQNISLQSDVEIVSGKTLIFLDEIQRAPELFAKLRYFYEKRSDIHVVVAGSLLDFMLSNHTFSMPVGRIEYLHMGPMDFKEYLVAAGAKRLHDYLCEYQIDMQIPKPVHDKLLTHLRTYMSIGGMPAAVREYIESNSPKQCEMELSSILNTYGDDFSKYQQKVDVDKLRLILDKVPGLVGKKLKYTDISRDDKSAKIKTGLNQLELARILYKVHHSAGNAPPLRAEKKERDYKLLFLDIGLLMRSLGLNILHLQEDNFLISNSGALTEQFIGQQWLSQQQSYDLPELYYWNREKTGTSAEVDYLFQIDGIIVPVEVKAGTTGSLKSLHVFAAEKQSPVAVRYNLCEPSVTEVTSRIPGKKQHTFKLLSLPLYLVSETERLLKQEG